MFKCPFPGCTHVAAHIILNSHAREHGFRNTTEMSKKYGKIRSASITPEVTKWAQQQSPSISKFNFDGIEAQVSRLKKNSDDKASR